MPLPPSRPDVPVHAAGLFGVNLGYGHSASIIPDKIGLSRSPVYKAGRAAASGEYLSNRCFLG